jgi:hypothetical protein
MRGQRHAPAGYYLRERPNTHCTGGWVGPRIGMDRCGKSCPNRDSIPGQSSPWPVAIPTELSRPTKVIHIKSRVIDTQEVTCVNPVPETVAF